jgi:Tetratricopeptide repeat
LAAMDNLAMAYLKRTIDSGVVENLPHACRNMLEVVERRKKKLGKDHPITLWAIANLARVKNAQGDHSEAESLFRAGILPLQRLGQVSPSLNT